MLQYPVPQFTEVEDKLIGSLTIRQFGILFGAGMFIFLLYSATKSFAALAILLLFVGLPAVFIAFAKINGRPLYRTFGVFFKFFTGPKLLVFHKESGSISSTAKLNTAVMDTKEQSAPVQPAEDTKMRIKKLNALLQQQSQEQENIINRN